MYKRAQSVVDVMSKDVSIFLWYVALGEESCPHGVIHIMIEVGNLIRKPHHLSLKGAGISAGLMVPYPILYLIGKIQTKSALFYHLKDSYRLFAVHEALPAQPVKHSLSAVSKRRVADIMAQGYGFRQILVKS